MSDFDTALATVDELLAPPRTKARMSQALAACNALLEAFPDDPRSHRVYGRLLTEIGQYDAALPYLQSVMRVMPDDLDVAEWAGIVLYHLRQFDQAAIHLHRRLMRDMVNGKIELAESNLEVAGMLGTAMMHCGHYAVAANFFRSVVAVAAKLEAQGRADASIPSYDDIAPSPPRRIYPVLYLPVEVKARELEGKLLIAAYAAAHGLTVVLGASWNLLHNGYGDLPPGVILFKTMNVLDGSVMKRAIAAGHVTAALDEEAFGRANNVRVFRLNVDARAIARVDRVMLQGSSQQDVLAQVYPKATMKAVITGNPKADLFRPEFKGGRHLEAGFGDVQDCILVCLMSGNVNNNGRTFATSVRTTLQLGGTPLDSDVGRSYVDLFSEAVAFEIAMIPQVRAMIRAVAEAFPERTVVVRPHPVEDVSLWIQAFSNLSNVVVRSDGPLVQWLPRSSAAIYLTGCASGLESYLAGVPSIRFEGDGSAAEPGVSVSGLINIPARTAEETINRLKDIFSGSISPPEGKDAIAQILYMRADQPASYRIATELSALVAHNGREDNPPLGQIFELAKGRSQPFRPQDFHRRKFPHTAVEEIADSLERLRVAAGIAASLEVFEIDDNTFVIARVT